MSNGKSFFSRFKPGVNKKVHLLLAALLWSCVGVMLMLRGIFYLGQTEYPFVLGAVGCTLGFLKSFLILDKVAQKSLYRIEQFSDRTCLGAVYSLKTWVLVICMMVAGMLLRMSHLPAAFLALLYCTIGWSLFFSSRHGWSAWIQGR